MITAIVVGALALSALLALGVARVLRYAGACARCGHTGTAHEHYRSGSDCGQCKCPSFVAKG